MSIKTNFEVGNSVWTLIKGEMVSGIIKSMTVKIHLSGETGEKITNIAYYITTDEGIVKRLKEGKSSMYHSEKELIKDQKSITK
ncbi:MAG: hypothetical protein AMXMBFR48_25000 [Ignavibacteriales bacterium]